MKSLLIISALLFSSLLTFAKCADTDLSRAAKSFDLNGQISILAEDGSLKNRTYENNDPGLRILEALESQFSGQYELISAAYPDISGSEVLVFGREVFSCALVLIQAQETDTLAYFVQSIDGNEISAKEDGGEGSNFTFIKK